jgi:hypothetical protein
LAVIIVTVSAGGATFLPNGSPESILERADRALCAVKARDRTLIVSIQCPESRIEVIKTLPGAANATTARSAQIHQHSALIATICGFRCLLQAYLTSGSALLRSGEVFSCEEWYHAIVPSGLS